MKFLVSKIKQTILNQNVLPCTEEREIHTMVEARALNDLGDYLYDIEQEGKPSKD